MITRPAWTASKNVEKVGEIERHLTAKDTKKTQSTLADFPGLRLILSVCGIAVKERPIHDFKGLTRGGRPLSRWKFPVAGTEP
jgi:hypothetical protein